MAYAEKLLQVSAKLSPNGMLSILAGSDSAGENLGLFIAEPVLYTTGFFGVLYSAYTLVLDRCI